MLVRPRSGRFNFKVAKSGRASDEVARGPRALNKQDEELFKKSNVKSKLEQ